MRFSKWHGLGNDYLLVERADVGRPLEAPLVRRLCDYHLGSRLGRDPRGARRRWAARAEIVIWNPDGSTAELSGNGTRIAARWLARRSGADEVVVAVGPREVVARMRGGLTVETEMGRVEVGRSETLAINGAELEFTPVSVGNPHAVIRREPDRADLLRLGPLVENHDRFPARTNVQLVRVDSPSETTVGVWERGAGETLSSGHERRRGRRLPRSPTAGSTSPVTVHLAGGDMRVELDEDLNARLTGAAQEICVGEVSAGAAGRR